MRCEHDPLGGAPFGVLWNPEATFKGDGDDDVLRVGTAVCRRCGVVFAGLFGGSRTPTPGDGFLKYRGPYVPGADEQREHPPAAKIAREQEDRMDLMTAPHAWLRTLTDDELDEAIALVPDREDDIPENCEDPYGWQQEIDGKTYRIPIGWAQSERQIRQLLKKWKWEKLN